MTECLKGLGKPKVCIMMGVVHVIHQKVHQKEECLKILDHIQQIN